MNKSIQKAIYIGSFLITSMSFAMKTKFPTSITRFAITQDGERLATSEDEMPLYPATGMRLLVRTWQRNERGQYDEIKNDAIVLRMPLGSDIKLHWLPDQQRIAVLAKIAADVYYSAFDANTLNVIESVPSSELGQVDGFFSAHGEDYYCFLAQGKLDAGTALSIPLQGGKIDVTPNAIVWLPKS
jgi:hypothetical protein